MNQQRKPEIKVKCADCGSRLRVTEKYFGKRVPCPKCKTAMNIPQGTTQAAAVIEEPESHAFETESYGVAPGDSDPDFSSPALPPRRRRRPSPDSGKASTKTSAPARQEEHPEPLGFEWVFVSGTLILLSAALVSLLGGCLTVAAAILPQIELITTYSSEQSALAEMGGLALGGLLVAGGVLVVLLCHLLMCCSPAALGVQHIAKKAVLVDVMMPVLAIGLALMPFLADGHIVGLMVLAALVWVVVQISLTSYLLAGCADFTEHKGTLDAAVLSFKLSLGIAGLAFMDLLFPFIKIPPLIVLQIVNGLLIALVVVVSLMQIGLSVAIALMVPAAVRRG